MGKHSGNEQSSAANHTARHAAKEPVRGSGKAAGSDLPPRGQGVRVDNANGKR